MDGLHTVLKMLRKQNATCILTSIRHVSIKEKLKNYKFPEIKKDDCEQKFISGWGPGGQKVNTAQNAVQLRHKPTGLVVKVSERRSPLFHFFALI
ncbi:unnamed protein product [Haemonchus placei]|uniref:RF_PROK_I domain-containing protein n=1 Tax=Haemonchus placei TaxID=6290 RepID=A0A0N4W548_HAEPC|nr:unnamed protein product [Haemonchus placei]